MKETVSISRKWTIEKHLKSHLPNGCLRIRRETSVFGGNLLLNEGITALLNLLIGAAETSFSNANAYLGVGDTGLAALTGTLTFTNGSTAVTGSSTSFSSEIAAGDKIQLDADGTLVRVASVTNDTALVLEELYNDTGGAGAGSVIKPTETGLAASTNKLYKAMEDGYPSISGQTVSFRSQFNSSEANFAWNEFTVANGDSDSADNLNRKVSSQGTKSSGDVWILTLSITFK
jgi:hypothetical protein